MTSYPESSFRPVSSARVHHAALGDPEVRDAYEADEVVVRRLLAAGVPVREMARANRAFYLRAVTCAVRELGIAQVLDIGPGLPPYSTRDTHSIADEHHHFRSRVLYADADPVVVAHWRMWADGARHRAEVLDLCDPDMILAEARAHFDLRRPVAVVLTAVLQDIADDDHPHACVRRIMDALPSRSALIVSHLTHEQDPQLVHRAVAVSREAGLPLHPRGFEEIARFFDGLTPIGPGLLPLSLWHPTHADDQAQPMVHAYGGVGLT
ncbi:SAM-dependent methyltransferase [Streptomyces qinzhouensis]|uniref:SAM-dependent methyltransferase n=1 Tax=Streptomyces qinzhouensis TaxID=2599401 RepID=UPI001644D86E|nr:SAM-dependent methyltransferase [Streptomyces qinzhouensis]